MRRACLDPNELGERTLLLAIGVVGFGLVGALWAPVAGAICALIARGRQLEGSGYAGRGAGYSALLLFPWIYFVFRLVNGIIPAFIVLVVYTFVYLIWTIGLMGSKILLLASIAVTLGDDNPTPILGTSLLGGFTLMLIAVSAYTGINSLKRLVRARELTGGLTSYSEELSIPSVYLEPFKWLIAWAVITVVMSFLAGMYALSQM